MSFDSQRTKFFIILWKNSQTGEPDNVCIGFNTNIPNICISKNAQRVHKHNRTKSGLEFKNFFFFSVL